MDPNLFHIDWERTIEALVGIIVLSFLIERALALVFESRWWIRVFEDARVGQPPSNGGESDDTQDAKAKTPDSKTTKPDLQKLLPGRKYPLKEGLGFLLALVVCLVWDFDAVSIVLLSEHTQIVGKIVTAGIIAGGSKASIALFHDLLKIKSSAAKEKSSIKPDKKD
jgi:hypothetical protein